MGAISPSRQQEPATITTYTNATTQYVAYAREVGMPLTADKVAREHVEQFLIHIGQSASASTAETRYRGLRQFFGWRVEEGFMKVSPMANMKPPKVGQPEKKIPEKKVPEKKVPEKASLEAILAPLRKAKVDQWKERRDAAIISLFAGTGMRLSELTNLTMADVDLERDKGGLAKVTGKGNKFRVVSFRPDAANDLSRWISSRRWYLTGHGRDPQEVKPLWIGLKGNALTTSGVRQMVWNRSEAVCERIQPHQLRHLFASEWLRAGKSESGLMEIGGWASRAMIDNVYARGNRAERAIEEHLRG